MNFKETGFQCVNGIEVFLF